MILSIMQDSFWDRIQDVRNTELGVLWRSSIVAAFYAFVLNAVPVIVSVLTFTAYVVMGNKLTASKAFTALSLFTVSASETSSDPCPLPPRLSLFSRHTVHTAFSRYYT